uniref:4Fe-4S ferredoxin-type domain-containing protein n=1 Tax=Steinernema glaseri TaxID=37863 RepID=A0A1I7ZXW2_9BILA
MDSICSEATACGNSCPLISLNYTPTTSTLSLAQNPKFSSPPKSWPSSSPRSDPSTPPKSPPSSTRPAWTLASTKWTWHFVSSSSRLSW